MAVEVVLLAPLLVAFMLLVLAFGRFVAVRGEIEAASRDAARAASLERDAGAAQAAATAAADLQVPDSADCGGAEVGGNFAAGGTVTVTLRCNVDLSDLGLIGLGGSTEFVAESAAPIDVFRRTG